MVDVQLDDVQRSVRNTSSGPIDVMNPQSSQSSAVPSHSLISTRSEVFKLVKDYMRTHGGAAGGASQAVRALTELSPRIHGPLTFQIFCDLVLKVDKTKLGSLEDPTLSILTTANEYASPEFWQAGADKSCEDQLVNLMNRCRNWISVLSRQNSFDSTAASLETFYNLPLTDSMVKNINLPNTIETLQSQTSNSKVISIIDKLVHKFPDAFGKSAKPTELPNQVSSLKLFGDGGALKLRPHKRARDSSNTTTTESTGSLKPSSIDTTQSTDTSFEEQTSEPPVKRTKSIKRVHWKPNHELVQVRYFEMDGIARFKSAKTAKIQEHDEGSAMHPHLEWRAPKDLVFTGAFNEQLTPLMSSRRGGTLRPKSEEAFIQQKRESSIPGNFLNNSSEESPKEPFNMEDTKPESNHKPKDGGKFTAAPPPAEWLQKQSQILNPQLGLNPALAMNNGMHMGNPAMSTMVPPMMPAFPWGMNFPMGMNMGMNMNLNIGIPPVPMSDMVDRKGNMMAKQQNQ